MNAQSLLLCSFALFLAACGNLSHDVSHKKGYQRGGCIPGHIYRLKTDAIVVTRAGYSALSLVRKEELRHEPLEGITWQTQWHVPAGTHLRVDSVFHHWEVGITEENWLEISGKVLDGRHDHLTVEVSYGFTDRDGPRPQIPVLDLRYLEDITKQPDEHR